MKQLAAGDLSTEVPYAGRKDEIGDMAAAVAIFRKNAIEVRDLNAQEQVLREKSADLQSSIATVVHAAAAGDFKQRIDKDYGNDDLNRFAASVNELVSSVDTGINETRRVIAALAEGDLTGSMNGSTATADSRTGVTTSRRPAPRSSARTARSAASHTATRCGSESGGRPGAAPLPPRLTN